MKKHQTLMMALCLSCALAASCSSKEPQQPFDINIPKEPQAYPAEVGGDGADREAKSQQGEDVAISDASVEVAYGADKGDSDGKISQKKSKARGDVDIDLTDMSATMVYATVDKVMKSPKGYIGKTIRARGPYNSVLFEETGLHYHFVVIEDATACCKQGFEFVWKGDHKYPDDYPKEEARIEVVGVFESYKELGKTYYHLMVDRLSVMK